MWFDKYEWNNKELFCKKAYIADFRKESLVKEFCKLGRINAKY